MVAATQLHKGLGSELWQDSFSKKRFLKALIYILRKRLSCCKNDSPTDNLKLDFLFILKSS
jgi:hypothetical protein